MKDYPISSVNAEFNSSRLLAALIYVSFVFLFPFTKVFGGVNLVLFTVLVFLHVFVFKTSFLLGPFTALLGLSAIGFLYLFLTVSSLVPVSWTTLYSLSAAFQQAAFIVILPLAYLFFSSVLWSHTASPKDLKRLAIMMVLSGFASVLLGGFLLSNGRTLSLLSIAGTSFVPANIILGLSLLYGLSNHVRGRLSIGAVFLLGSVLSPFSQNYALGLAGLLLFFLPRLARLISFGYVASSLAIYYILYDNLEVARIVDSNLFVRLIIIGDAFSGFFMTDGIGVGFGTESLSNSYPEVEGGTAFDQSEAGYINISAHNSFATFAFRMGILGILAITSLFIALWFKIPKRCADVSDGERIIIAMAFLALYTVTFLNPGFESYLYLYGVGLYIVFITFPWRGLLSPGGRRGESNNGVML